MRLFKCTPAGILITLPLVISPASAEPLVFNNVVADVYNAPVNRGGCFRLVTDGLVDVADSFRSFDTFNSEANTFAGLIATGMGATPKVIDSVTLSVGFQFGNGGNFSTPPNLYLLVNNVDTNTALPAGNANWVPVTAFTTDHVAGASWKFMLTGTAAERTAYGFAVGGVPGSGDASFLAVSELSAEGPAAETPMDPPSDVVSVVYHSPDSRSQVFTLCTDGIVDPGGGFINDHGFDTFAGLPAATQPDFAGLIYANRQQFDTVTLSYGLEFGDGGRFAEPPKLYIRKNTTDTNTDNPATNSNWREVPTAVRSMEAHGVSFNLTGLPAEDRQGFGWAIGGVNGSNTMGFISVSELSASGVLAPLILDTDGDGMTDAWETTYSLMVNTDDSAEDADGDGLTNLREFEIRTHPRQDDTDGDGLDDLEEDTEFFTNPTLADTDDDGLSDSVEINSVFSNAKVADTDGDGLNDGAEVNTHLTSPLAADTDGDGVNDRLELQYASNPKNAASIPDNIALSGTAITGTSESVSEFTGTPFSNAGMPSHINDGNLLSRMDTFNSPGAVTASYAGILWTVRPSAPVTRLDLTLATFFDGGWFGPNNSGPGASGLLTAGTYLAEPAIQITTDAGVTWTVVPHTSDYLTSLEGHALPPAFGLPTSKKASFTLTNPQAGIDGIRIIGPEGGTASQGFLGVFELEVYAPSAPVDTDGDGQSDLAEATAGTDPADSNSYLRVTSAVRNGNQMELTWASVPGKNYQVQTSQVLGSWSPLGVPVPATAAATTTSLNAALPDPAPAKVFFRVLVVP